MIGLSPSRFLLVEVDLHVDAGDGPALPVSRTSERSNDTRAHDRVGRRPGVSAEDRQTIASSGAKQKSGRPWRRQLLLVLICAGTLGGVDRDDRIAGQAGGIATHSKDPTPLNIGQITDSKKHGLVQFPGLDRALQRGAQGAEGVATIDLTPARPAQDHVRT